MRKIFLLLVLAMAASTWCVLPAWCRSAKPEKEYAKVKMLLSDAKRAAQVGAEASALEKYGEALVLIKQIERKNPKWKRDEVRKSLANAESGYIRTLTGMVIRLQNVATQRGEITKQQDEIIKKMGILVNQNAQIMKFLQENRDLIERIETSPTGT